MGNQLFQLAETAVHRAEQAVGSSDLQEKVNIAKNQLSSAYANSTTAEKEQLSQLQQQLDKCEQTLNTDYHQLF